MYHILFLICIFSLSQAANLIRLAQAPIEVIGFWRLLGSGLIMLTISLLQREKEPKKPHKNSLLFTLLSGVFFFSHLWTFFYSAQHTTIANCMIIFATNPLFTALISIFIFKEKLTLRLISAYFMALIGIYLLFQEGIEFQPAQNLGNFSALLSALLYTGYILAGKKSRESVRNQDFTWKIYLLAAVLFFMTGGFKDLDWLHYPSITWFAIAGNILLPTLLGHALFTYLLQHLNVNWMSCGKLIEPTMSAVVAFFLFNEKPTFQVYLAFAFTAVAVIILFAPALKKKNV